MFTTGTIRLRIHAKDKIQTKISAIDGNYLDCRPMLLRMQRASPLEKAEDAIDVAYIGITGVRLEIKTAE
jgi:hypothetical protein